MFLLLNIPKMSNLWPKKSQMDFDVMIGRKIFPTAVHFFVIELSRRKQLTHKESVQLPSIIYVLITSFLIFVSFIPS